MSTEISVPSIKSPGALIAALPAVLGFVPEKSLVLITLEDGQMGAVLRADWDENRYAWIAELAELAAAGRAEAAIAVIVDADGAGCAHCAPDHAMACQVLDAQLREHGLRLYAGHVVDRIAAGGHWHCADGCGRSGQVDDPDATPLAAAAVLDGRRRYRRRAELAAVVAPAGQDRRSVIADLVTRAAEAADTAPRGLVEAAISLVARWGRGDPVSDGELAAVGASLTDIPVRDTLYGLAVTEHADAAEDLWAELARLLPAPWRVEALVLLAFTAYARGDGPLAGVALDAALSLDGEHRMGAMLDIALRSGLRPERIRGLAGTGNRLAREMGVTLPPARRAG